MERCVSIRVLDRGVLVWQHMSTVGIPLATEENHMALNDKMILEAQSAQEEIGNMRDRIAIISIHEDASKEERVVLDKVWEHLEKAYMAMAHFT